MSLEDKYEKQHQRPRKRTDIWQPSKSKLWAVVLALLDADGHMRRKALLASCKDKMSGQAFVNCVKTLERQGAIQTNRLGRKNVEYSLNYETSLYPVKTVKKMSEIVRPDLVLSERPAELFERLRLSYQQLLLDLRNTKTRAKATEMIELFLQVYLNPQVKKHAENFWSKVSTRN